MIATSRPADKSSLGLMGMNSRPRSINKGNRLASINLDDSATDYSTPDDEVDYGTTTSGGSSAGEYHGGHHHHHHHHHRDSIGAGGYPDIDDEFDISHGAHHRYSAEDPTLYNRRGSDVSINFNNAPIGGYNQFRQRSSGSTNSGGGSGCINLRGSGASIGMGGGSSNSTGNGHSSRWLTMNGMIAEYQHSEDNYNIAACALVERGEEKTKLQGFVEDRVSTFNKNINYAQHQAAELAKNIGEEVQENQVTTFVEHRLSTFKRNWEIISTDWFGNDKDRK